MRRFFRNGWDPMVGFQAPDGTCVSLGSSPCALAGQGQTAF